MILNVSYMSNYSVIVFISSLYMRPLLLLHISTFEDTSLYLCRLTCTISIYSIYCFLMFSEIPSILGSSSNSVGWWRIGGSQRAQRERVEDNLWQPFSAQVYNTKVSLELLSCFPAILIHFDQETEVEESIEEQYSGSGPKWLPTVYFWQGVKVKAKMGSPLSAENRA